MHKIIFFTVIMFGFAVQSYAMDWQRLHDQADHLSLEDAQEKALENPQSAQEQYVLGLVCLNLHQDQQADAIFNKLLMDNPDLKEAKWGKAEVLRRRHDSFLAENLLNEVIKLDPQFSPALISLAYIKYFQMNYKASVKLALKVIEQGRNGSDLSNYVRAYAMYAGAKGMLAHYGGLFSKGIDGLAVKPNLEKALKLQPKSAAVLFGLGSFYLLAPAIAGGDKAKAEVFLNQAIEADPLFADAYVRLGQLAKINGNQQECDFFLQKALEIDPGNELAQDIISRRCKFICVNSLN
ncbi:MAG: hypothetical protein PHS66_01255 [Candidatus Omnitrophica bacterium]|nr:hypothetical protein [Candidatus Omnitrophota bacterium]